MTDLRRGATVALVSDFVQVAVRGAVSGSVDLMVFQVTASGKVRTDADMVFFNQPQSPEEAVRLTGPDRLEIALAGVPSDIAMLVVSVTLDDSIGGSLVTVPGLAAVVADGQTLHCAPATGLTTERAAILVEVYRRGDGWKLRNVSAGWDSGLAALAGEYGVQVDDPGPATPPTPQISRPDPAAVAIAPAAATPAGPRSVPGEETLSPQQQKTLDQRKQQVYQVLLTKRAQQVRARVLLVIDKTGSMSKLYKKGVVHRVVERMVPVAIALDDDGSLECYLYAESYYKLPDLTVAVLAPWIAEWVHLSGKHGGLDYRRIGTVNDEIPILTEIIGQLSVGDPMPTLVLFFTDGGFHKKAPIIELIRRAASLPAFFQFVGIGRPGAFGILEKLDEMEGRVVDNVGFFPVTDIDDMDDAELYRLLLGDFPDWLRAARSQHIVG